MQRRVRFARKNDTHWIERRGEDRLSKDHIDDEVKDHPAFSNILSQPDPHPKLPPPVLSTVGYASEISKQLETDPQRKTVFNPITQRTITRFGNSYWKLIVSVFGSHSPTMASEKEIYRKLYNK
jgi:hypothetical protein